MTRRKNNYESPEPYWHNEAISLFPEITFKKKPIANGDLIKIKHQTSIFRFIRLVVNSETGKEWIDVFDTTLGGWRSFTVDKISGPFIAKKSRAKKVVTEE